MHPAVLLVHPVINVKRQKCPSLIFKKNVTSLSPSLHLRFPSSSFGSALSSFFLLLHLPHLPASSHFFFFLLLLPASSLWLFFFFVEEVRWWCEEASCVFFFQLLFAATSSCVHRRGQARELDFFLLQCCR